jgi:NAD dependent epimerase/dehydratase family enzyme
VDVLIHLEDVVATAERALTGAALDGSTHVVAHNPASNREFSADLARACAADLARADSLSWLSAAALIIGGARTMYYHRTITCARANYGRFLLRLGCA